MPKATKYMMVISAVFAVFALGMLFQMKAQQSLVSGDYPDVVPTGREVETVTTVSDDVVVEGRLGVKSPYTGEFNMVVLDDGVGIGTTSPSSKLEVAGVIHSTTGGIKFPDNTVQTTAAAGSEVWRLGAGILGIASHVPSCTNFATMSSFRGPQFLSNWFDGSTELYWAFPAASSDNSIESVDFYSTMRSGSYAGDANVTLELLDCDGILQHIVSDSGIDTQTVPLGVWHSLTLSGNPSDLVVSPGELLVLHFALSGENGGDLRAGFMFDVKVK